LIATLSNHTIKTTLQAAIAGLVTPDPDGPVKKVKKGHFSLLESEDQTLFTFFAGSEQNSVSSNEILLPGSFMFSVAGVAQTVPTTFMGSGPEEAEERASLTLSAWIDAFNKKRRLGLSGIRAATILSTRASDADEYGNAYADTNNVPLWVEGLTLRVDLL